ncbi:uncharacterized protein LOC106733250 isoform X2 [Tupaia chinensis]|uniref:uncharacterized protein LOC106733250 isoform X2 n=1 Tax=Tupaia chinensis TaxID=246437 RepID=UPI000703C3DF|nr:uncharacterized protein LOC106733250 isoform X2 [Tupaia chinensis]
MPVSSGCIEASSCPLPGPRSKAVGTQLLCAASPGAAPLSVVPSAATGGSTEQPGPLGPLPGSFCRYRRCSRAGDTAEPGRWVRSPPGSRQRSRAQPAQDSLVRGAEARLRSIPGRGGDRVWHLDAGSSCRCFRSRHGASSLPRGQQPGLCRSWLHPGAKTPQGRVSGSRQPGDLF